MLLSVRELLVRQRTQLVNALRGHAAELGLVAAKGDRGVAALLAAIGDGCRAAGAGGRGAALLGQRRSSTAGGRLAGSTPS